MAMRKTGRKQRQRRYSVAYEGVPGIYNAPGFDFAEHWRAWVSLEERAGRLVVTRLVVEPKQEGVVPPQGLTQRALREVPLEDAKLELLDRVRDRPQSGVFLAPEAVKQLMSQEGRRGPGKPKSDDLWAVVAERYLDALRTDPRRPRRAMVAQYQRDGMRRMNVETVRDWVRAARDHGFLTKAEHGRPGAEAGDRLIQWRKKQQRETGDT